MAWRAVRRFCSDLSRNKYDVTRSNFKKPDSGDVDFFRGVLGHDRVLTDEWEVRPYNRDWVKNCRGDSKIVLQPSSTGQVSQVLRYCNDANIAVCPQGGNTGLVGGSVPVFDEVVVSMSKMNNVLSLDPVSGVIVCEAGCVLETLDEHLREHRLMMPLDLGAKGSCQIGGNVSTNAGGLRLLRYGNLHGSVLGVEAVLANGDIVDCLGTLKKDNTGYHLKHLFIGSEGTLGLVTKVSVNCPTAPAAVHVAFLGADSFERVLELYLSAKARLGEVLSAFELIDHASLEASTCSKNPITRHPFYVLIETSGSDGTHDAEKLNAFLEEAMSSGLVKDGTFTDEPSRVKVIWSIREGITEGLLRDGYVLKYDFSMPIRDYYKIVEVMREKIGPEAVRICGYGHVGDSNIHFNITLPKYDSEVVKKIEPFVFDFVSQHSGSISAEHGIGFKKSKYLHYSKSESAIGLMKQIKSMMDPKGILNPYKVLA